MTLNKGKKVTASEKTISSILKDLSNVHENLLSLSDDIWNSIDHNNPEKLDEGYQFKKEFNRLLDDFEKNKNDISVLVSQFTGVKLVDKPEYISKQNRKYYSASPKELRKPVKVMNDFFVETNRNANDLMKSVIDLLNYFEIPLSNMTIYLRQDRNA